MAGGTSGRGAGWVAGQVVVLAVFGIAAPATAGASPALVVRAAAVALIACGVAIGVMAAWRLGRSLTPFPRPVANATLCREGPYRWVRHPIYSGVLLMAAGWALWWQSAIAAILLPLVFAFFAFKARAEERWLASAYAGYGAYAAQVKALVPYIY